MEFSRFIDDVILVHPTCGSIRAKKTPFLKSFSRHITANPKTVTMKSRQIGGSTGIHLYGLWSALRGRRVLFVTHNNQSSQSTFTNIRRIYNDSRKIQSISDEVSGESYKSIGYRSDGDINILTTKQVDRTSHYHGLDRKYDVVLIDEMSFHHEESLNNIFTEILPTYLIHDDTEIHIISTPNRKSGLFFELWYNNNEFSKLTYTLIEATEDNWDEYCLQANNIKNEVNKELFDQQYHGLFLNEEDKTEVINIRVTTSERVLLQRKVDISPFRSISEYIRHVGLA